MPATLSRIAVVLDDMQAKHRFLSESLGGRYRPDAADALVEEIAGAGRDLATLLRDRARVRVTWVLLPEALSLAEARDGVAALDASGIGVDDVLVNRVTPPPPAPCALCDGRRVAEAGMLHAARRDLGPRPVRIVPALEREPRGIAALRALASKMSEAPGAARPRRAIGHARPGAGDDRWLASAAPSGRSLVLFAGKGGVGKTTCAAALALTLAARRNPPRVLLMSTDPAHSLGDVLDVTLGDKPAAVPGAPPALRAREID